MQNNRNKDSYYIKKEYVPFLSARNEAYSFYNTLKFKNAHLRPFRLSGILQISHIYDLSVSPDTLQIIE